MKYPGILTRSGGYLDFENPHLHAFPIEDIAHALSQVCRFAGHSDQFYSVAQHSVLVSRIVPRTLALRGLLHDASEAYLGDMTTPLKALIPGYRRLERLTQRAIMAAHGLDGARDWRALEVRTADRIALATEQRDIMHNSDPWPSLDGAAPRRGRITALPPELAKQAFIRRYQELTE